MSASRSRPDEWMVRAYSICVRDEVLLGVLGEQVAQHHDAVQRRAELVGHVREELGLVFRHERELLRLLFEVRARLGDLPVLDLEEAGLVLELGRAPFELDVGALELLEQLLGSTAGADHVEDHADARASSCSRKVRWIALNGSKEPSSMTARTWSSNRIGQHHDVPRRRLAEARRDRHVVLGDLGDDDRLLLERRLTNEPLAEREPVRDALAARVAVGGEELQHRPLLVACS